MSSKRTFRFTLVAKLFILLVAFASLPGAGMAFWTLRQMTASRAESKLAAMEAVANAKAEAIERFIEYRRANVERIASMVAERVEVLREELEGARDRVAPDELPDLEDGEELDGEPGTPPAGTTSFEEPLAREATAAEAHARVRRMLGHLLWDRSEFEELLVIDGGGHVLVSTYDGHEDRDASSVEYFAQGLRGTYLQPVFLSPITERHTMVVSTPIYSDDREVIAVLAARLNLDHFFSLLTDTTGLGATGETIAAEEVEGVIVLRAPTRHDPGASPGDQLTIDGLPVGNAARGESGLGRSRDYRGVDVLAAWRHIDSLGWGLVVKLDVDEAMAPVADLEQTLWVAFLVVVIVAALIAVVVAGTIVRPLRQLRSAADRISRGDMGVSIDIESRDEVGELAESFERMIAAIRFFREQGAGRAETDDEALQREIEAEAALQREEEGG